MRISPISGNYSFTKTAKNFVKKPLNALGLISAGVSAGILAGKNKQNNDVVTKEDIKNKLINLGYKEENGVLWKESDKEENTKLKQNYGFFGARHFKNVMHRPFADEDLFEMQVFIETGKETGKILFKDNFETLFRTYAVLKNSECLYEFMVKCNRNPDTFRLVENLANTPLDKETYKSISKYKGKAYIGLGQKMQESLRAQAANDKYKIGHRVQNCIKNIASYIDKQIIPESVKLYRGEGCHTSLTNVKTSDGNIVNLGHMMFNASNSINKNLILQVKEFIQDNELSLKMPAFMSTSLDKNVAEDFSKQYSFKDKVVWEFSVKPDTKGSFIEALYANAYFEKQNEVLLQKGSVIIIKDADYDEKKDVWLIKAEVSN